jgi:hypothetical protein
MSNPYVEEIRKKYPDFVFREMPQLIEINFCRITIKSCSVEELVETDKFIAKNTARDHV